MVNKFLCIVASIAVTILPLAGKAQTITTVAGTYNGDGLTAKI
jgi:hypothetical protein